MRGEGGGEQRENPEIPLFSHFGDVIRPDSIFQILSTVFVLGGPVVCDGTECMPFLLYIYYRYNLVRHSFDTHSTPEMDPGLMTPPKGDGTSGT